MTSIRIMTYNLRGFKGEDGRVDPRRPLQVIADGAPDILAVQEAAGVDNALTEMAERLGMRLYGGTERGVAFLSYYPLHGVAAFDLGGGGLCLRADAEINGQRLHLFNVRFAATHRRQQIASLLGPELLSHRSLGSPCLILGDFADYPWSLGNLELSLALRKGRQPWWGGTYPALFPLLARDRAYLRGDIRILDASIDRSRSARQASSHLPFVLTVKVTDPRRTLKVSDSLRKRMNIVPG